MAWRGIKVEENDSWIKGELTDSWRINWEELQWAEAEADWRFVDGRKIKIPDQCKKTQEPCRKQYIFSFMFYVKKNKRTNKEKDYIKAYWFLKSYGYELKNRE